MLWKLYGIKGDTQMKKTDNKSNARLKNVVVMILAAIVVIGLLSSSAIKLATATYLMQSSKKVNTGIPIIDNYVNDQIDNMNQQPTQAPTTTKAPETTKAPSTTKAPETTKAPDTTTTKAPETTKAPSTTKAPETTESTTSEQMLINGYQSVLKSYNDVLTSNKVAGHRPGFTKVTERSFEKNFWTSIFAGKADKEEGVANYLAGGTVTVEKGAQTDALGLNNAKYASTIDHTDYETVKAAVSSASKKAVIMGYVKNVTSGEIVHGYNKDVATGEIEYMFDYNEADYELSKEVEAVRVQISFNDETNPVPADKNGKTDSFIASVFPVVTGNQVLVAVDRYGATKADLTYTGCSVDIYYNNETAQIYSLTQYVNYDVDVEDGRLNLGGTVSETNKYTNFIY